MNDSERDAAIARLLKANEDKRQALRPSATRPYEEKSQ